MDLMQEHDDDLNRKVILLSVGSAAAPALLVALARHRDDEGADPRAEEVAARAEDAVAESLQKKIGRTLSDHEIWMIEERLHPWISELKLARAARSRPLRNLSVQQ